MSVTEDGIILIQMNNEENDRDSRLIRFISTLLETPEAAIEVISGLDKNDKIISIEGMETDILNQKIKEIASKR